MLKTLQTPDNSTGAPFENHLLERKNLFNFEIQWFYNFFGSSEISLNSEWKSEWKLCEFEYEYKFVGQVIESEFKNISDFAALHVLWQCFLTFFGLRHSKKIRKILLNVFSRHNKFKFHDKF